MNKGFAEDVRKKDAALWQAKQLRMLYLIKVRKPLMPNCLLCL